MRKQRTVIGSNKLEAYSLRGRQAALELYAEPVAAAGYAVYGVQDHVCCRRLLRVSRVCFVRMGMEGFVAGMVFLWRYLLISATVLLLLMGLSYLILCLLYKGKYSMLFEMDEGGILHTEAPEQRKKSRKLGVTAAVVGSVAGYPGAMGLAATGRSFY